MTNTMCGYPGDRDETLIAYLYDDMTPIERASFEAHLMRCDHCRAELADLRGVRLQLARWAPPEPKVVGIRDSGFGIRRSWWREIPAWAQVAAALLVLGVAGGVANLEVRYNSDGLTIRTGWSKTAATVAPVSAVAPRSGPASAPWRADLAALERQLRSEFHASDVAGAATAVRGGTVQTMSDAEIVRRVRALIDDSERRQQRELALRVAEVVRDVNAQRTADLVRIDRRLGLMQNNTGVDLLQQRELLNYVVRRVSQQP